MKKEYRKFILILLLGAGGLAGLGSLGFKYTPELFGHFIDTCKSMITGSISSGSHVAGWVVLGLIGIAAAAGVGRMILSLIKTQQKIGHLLKFNHSKIPKKLARLIKRHHVSESRVVVIDYPQHTALIFGLWQPRFLISTGLIRELDYKQLEAVVLHEMYHMRHNHGILLFASDVLGTTVFFLPVVKVLADKLRGFCERQADAFALSTQTDSKHLKLALAKVVPENNHYLYPGFAVVQVRERLDHLFGRQTSPSTPPLSAIFISFIVIILGIGLWLLPSQNYALAIDIHQNDCGNNQCSTHCLTDTQTPAKSAINYTSALFTPSN